MTTQNIYAHSEILAALHTHQLTEHIISKNQTFNQSGIV